MARDSHRHIEGSFLAAIFMFVMEAAGWTWQRFCEATGYAHLTPLRWFEKYSLRIAITNRPKETTGGKPPAAKPAPKETKPEVKKHVQPAVEAIADRVDEDAFKSSVTAVPSSHKGEPVGKPTGVTPSSKETKPEVKKHNE